ncbi:MAG TPA: cytochrome c oxidase subunit II [Candidatus Kryptonia bacterium]|nr:cytochrome c oxidase subunit II [Candidatus Kryptonia bacterium]
MLSWFPENISTFGGDIDSVFSMIYYIVGFWFILTQCVLLYFLFRYRRRAGQRAVYNRGDRWSELAWVLIPVAIVLMLDLGIDVAGGPVWARIKEQQPAGGVEVLVTAKQFNWSFTYPGPDGKFGTDDDLAIENELHVPVGQNVHLTLQAKDVIHSFFIPNVRLKQDVLPGRTIKGWFNATKTGQFEIACAELCGFGHYNMRGFLVVHDPADYQKWVSEHWPSSATNAGVAPVDGPNQPG